MGKENTTYTNRHPLMDGKIIVIKCCVLVVGGGQQTDRQG